MSEVTERLRTAISDFAPNRDLLAAALAEVERLTADISAIRPAAFTVIEGWDRDDQVAVRALLDQLARDPLTGLGPTARAALDAEGRQG